MQLVLLDRDGVINVDRPDSVKSPEELILIPGAAEAIARLNKAGIKVALITNQAVVGRGTISLSTLNAIHGRLHRQLATVGARLDEIFYCTDAVPSPRRKPAPGMLLEAIDKFSVRPEDTIMVGDDLRDLEAAAAAGCARILVRTGKGTFNEQAGLPEFIQPLSIYDDLSAAVEAILA